MPEEQRVEAQMAEDMQTMEQLNATGAIPVEEFEKKPLKKTEAKQYASSPFSEKALLQELLLASAHAYAGEEHAIDSLGANGDKDFSHWAVRLRETRQFANMLYEPEEKYVENELRTAAADGHCLNKHVLNSRVHLQEAAVKFAEDGDLEKAEACAHEAHELLKISKEIVDKMRKNE